MSAFARLRLDGALDVLSGLGLAIAAMLRQHQMQSAGPAVYVLWTLAIVVGVRGLARLTAVVVAMERTGPDSRS